jgi:pimeloyl-ACP methyl ester carboxylesterase
LGAPGLSIEENLYQQNAMIHRAEGVSEDMIKLYNSIQRNVFSIIKEELNDSIAIEKLRAAYTFNRYQLLSGEQKNSVDERINSLLLTPYFRDIIKCNPAEILKKVQCPVLAITGEKDLQAPSKQNLPEIEKALKSGNNRNYKLIELPGINHMMQTCQTGTMLEYPEIEETVSPLVLKGITDWILTQNK